MGPTKYFVPEDNSNVNEFRFTSIFLNSRNGQSHSQSTSDFFKGIVCKLSLCILYIYFAFCVDLFSFNVVTCL